MSSKLTRWVLVAACGLACHPTPAHAEYLDVVRGWVIQQDHRLESFDQFAHDTVASITGTSLFGAEDPVGLMLSMMAEPDRWRREPLIMVPTVQLRRALGLADTQTHICAADLAANERFVQALTRRGHRGAKSATGDQASMQELFERYTVLTRIFNHELRVVPPPSHAAESWLPVVQPEGYTVQQQVGLKRCWASLMRAVRYRREQDIEHCVEHVTLVLRNLNPEVYPPAWSAPVHRPLTPQIQ